MALSVRFRPGLHKQKGIFMNEQPKPLTTDFDLVFVDVETTGLNPFRHEIIEIAAKRLSPQFEPRGTLPTISSVGIPTSIELKVFPKHIEYAESVALQINGYDKSIWDAQAVSIDRAMRAFVELCSGGLGVVIVAHNVAFDWGFISATIEREGLDLRRVDYHRICLASMLWPLAVGGFLEKIKLETACDRLGISNEGHHRAMRDVDRAIEVYRRLVPPRRTA